MLRAIVEKCANMLGLRKIFGLAVLAVVPLVITGCESAIKTDITVIEQGRAAVTTSVTLDKLTTEAVSAEPSLDQQILDTMSAISNQGVQRSLANDQLTYTVRANPNDLPSDILGFSDLAVGTKGDNLVTSLTLTKPTKLIAAIESAFAEEPDSQALALTWQKSIKLSLKIETPGDIVLYSPYFFAEGKTATLEEYIADWPSGETASIESVPPQFPLLPVIIVVILVVFISVAFVVWKKR